MKYKDVVTLCFDNSLGVFIYLFTDFLRKREPEREREMEMQ